MSRRTEILAEIATVPALPVAAVKAISVLQGPDTDLYEIARVINHDPGLAANVLRLANSAMFGAQRETTTVNDAVARLGTRRILDLVVGSAVGPLQSKPIRGYDLPPGELWRYSVAVACGTEELATVLGMRPPESAFTAGLLIDVGKHVLGTYLQTDGWVIRQEASQRGISFEQAERHVLGIDHAEVGACLLKDWSLPSPLVSVARWHHDPEQCPPEHQPTVKLVHAADYICTLGGLGTGIDSSDYRPCESVLADLRLGEDVVEAAKSRILERFDTLGEILGHAAGST